MFLSPQGDVGEKGPEGAPGKDGARVSDCHSSGSREHKTCC